MVARQLQPPACTVPRSHCPTNSPNAYSQVLKDQANGPTDYLTPGQRCVQGVVPRVKRPTLEIAVVR